MQLEALSPVPHSAFLPYAITAVRHTLNPAPCAGYLAKRHSLVYGVRCIVDEEWL